MTHDLTLAPRAVRRRSPLTRLRATGRLARRDRLSAGMARTHATIAVLGRAQTVVEIGWGPTTSCGSCAAGHLPERGAGCCVVCALVLAGDPGDDTAVRAALDLTWRSLHRGRHRPLHWNPGAMHSVQAHELRLWNDRPGITDSDVAALLRVTRSRAQRDLERARTAARQLASEPS